MTVHKSFAFLSSILTIHISYCYNLPNPISVKPILPTSTAIGSEPLLSMFNIFDDDNLPGDMNEWIKTEPDGVNGDVDPPVYRILTTGSARIIIGPPLWYKSDNIRIKATGAATYLIGLVSVERHDDGSPEHWTLYGQYKEINGPFVYEIVSNNHSHYFLSANESDNFAWRLRRINVIVKSPMVKSNMASNWEYYSPFIMLPGKNLGAEMLKIPGISVLGPSLARVGNGPSQLIYVDELDSKHVMEFVPAVDLLPSGFGFIVPFKILPEQEGIFEFEFNTNPTLDRAVIGLGRSTDGAVPNNNVIQGIFYDGYEVRHDLAPYDDMWGGYPILESALRMRVEISSSKKVTITFWQIGASEEAFHLTELVNFLELPLSPVVLSTREPRNHVLYRVTSTPRSALSIQFAKVTVKCFHSTGCDDEQICFLRDCVFPLLGNDNLAGSCRKDCAIEDFVKEPDNICDRNDLKSDDGLVNIFSHDAADQAVIEKEVKNGRKGLSGGFRIVLLVLTHILALGGGVVTGHYTT